MRQGALACEEKTASDQGHHWTHSAVMAIQNTRVQWVRPDACSRLQIKTLKREDDDDVVLADDSGVNTWEPRWAADWQVQGTFSSK